MPTISGLVPDADALLALEPEELAGPLLYFLASLELSAGAIIAGFGATFLAFRVQREAQFYRVPGQTFNEQRFSSSFLLIIFATTLAVLAGVVTPLLGIQGVAPAWLTPGVAVSGLLGSITLIVGYFLDELVHYRIIGCNWRSGISDEWRREKPILYGSLGIAAVVMVLMYVVGG